MTIDHVCAGFLAITGVDTSFVDHVKGEHSLEVSSR
jgi:hypothetical protein